MKVNDDSNKAAVIEYLRENYKKLDWQRENNSSYEITTSVGNYIYRLGSAPNETGTGERYLIVTAKDSSCDIGVSAYEYKTVNELYKLVWRYTKLKLDEQDKQWHDILNDLTYHC